MTAKRILAINPNSNGNVTRAMQSAVQEFQQPGVLEIECRSIENGPFGIESDDDIEAALPLVVSEISRSGEFDAYIIACYSDPGLREARTICKKPVLGIQESAVMLAATYGWKFGVLALGRDSIQRHIAYVRQLGMQDFHAGERALHVSVEEASDPGTLAKIVETGRLLIDEDGADTVILGCAGMAGHRTPAQQALGVPVIDPTQAAVKLAIDSIAG